MRNLFKSRMIWGYVSKTHVKPKNTIQEGYVALINTWKANNIKIITLINNFVENS